MGQSGELEKVIVVRLCVSFCAPFSHLWLFSMPPMSLRGARGAREGNRGGGGKDDAKEGKVHTIAVNFSQQ